MGFRIIVMLFTLMSAISTYCSARPAACDALKNLQEVINVYKTNTPSDLQTNIGKSVSALNAILNSKNDLSAPQTTMLRTIVKILKQIAAQVKRMTPFTNKIKKAIAGLQNANRFITFDSKIKQAGIKALGAVKAYTRNYATRDWQQHSNAAKTTRTLVTKWSKLVNDGLKHKVPRHQKDKLTKLSKLLKYFTKNVVKVSKLYQQAEQLLKTLNAKMNSLVEDIGCCDDGYTMECTPFACACRLDDCSYKPGEDTTMNIALDGRTKTVRCIDGWTIVTLRKDGSQNFNQSWIAYKEGFGDVNSEHYIGNDFLYKLSNQESPYVIRIDMTDYNDLSLYAQYDLFYIGSEEMKYLLHLGEYSGTAGDSLTYEGLVKYVPFVAPFANEVYHNHMRFSTFDEDNDKSYGGNCAVTWESGFWFNKCFSSNLHGVYENSTRCTTKAKCMFWASWPGMNPITYYNMNTLKTVIIKMKPRDKL